MTSSYPLERSNERATQAVAALEVDARERMVKQRELEIESGVRAALREMERIRKSVELQRQGVETAAQQRRLAGRRYQPRRASSLDLVDPRRALCPAPST